ncbi:MAG: adenylate/guanylate cyclase domain-containing protein [Ginsengibacter sp.]
MLLKKICLYACLIGYVHIADAQNGASTNLVKQDTNTINTLLLESKNNFATDPEKAIQLSLSAKKLSDKLNFKPGAAIALKNIGIANYYQGKNIEALDYYHQSLKIYQAVNDLNGISNLENNIGAIYMNQGDDTKALEYFLGSLKVAEKAQNKLRILTATSNIGAIYSGNNSTLNKALYYDLKALPMAEELGDNDAIGTVSVNLGNIYITLKQDSLALTYLKKSLNAYGNSENTPGSYNAIGKLYFSQKKYKLAIENHRQAYAIAKKLNGKLDMVQSLQGIGKVYIKLGDWVSALNYFKEAENYGKEISAITELHDIYKDMAACYDSTGDFKNAYTSRLMYDQYNDTLYNNDKDKKLASLQFDFDLQKKQGEIAILKKDNELSDLELRRQRVARNSLIVGLILAGILAFVIYRNYRIKARTNKILDRQNAEIESLLLNILPSEVAKELQSTGHATPRHYESVSVMFTDFKGFTSMADKMTPSQIVEELNICFMAFDNIMEKYGLEKIKTIGDSYMCAGGIPSYQKDNACNTVRAGLKMLDFMQEYNKTRIDNGMDVWDIRIGIHVGPVVAGVVGKKKYAYDIWGSTVNIASRMESNGVAGMINISAATYEEIKNNYACDHRGKIYAKNVGEIDMYFVTNEIIPFEKTKGSQPEFKKAM